MFTKRLPWMLVPIAIGALSACMARTADEAVIEPESVAVISAAVSSEFVGCADDQIAIIRDAAEQAVTKGTQALSYLINRPNSERVQYWFGKPTFTFNVRDTLRRAIQRIANNTITYDCSGDWCDGALETARVFPERNDNRVHICCQFLNAAAPPIGYDRSAVLLHEMAHFEFPGDYGCEDRQQGHNLALNNPLAASRCAANYQFFVQNSREYWQYTDPQQCPY